MCFFFTINIYHSMGMDMVGTVRSMVDTAGMVGMMDIADKWHYLKSYLKIHLKMVLRMERTLQNQTQVFQILSLDLRESEVLRKSVTLHPSSTIKYDKRLGMHSINAYPLTFRTFSNGRNRQNFNAFACISA